MDIKISDPFLGVQFVLNGKDIIGCFHNNTYFDMHGIYSCCTLHDVYHRYIKGKENG